jgi:hypothetical protein
VKKTLISALAALLSGAIAAPVFAQVATGVQIPNMPPAPAEYGSRHPYVRDFNGYLDAHPGEAEDLRRNPRLVDNPNYLAHHPDLQAYLRAHPNVAKAYGRHPDAFMHRERRYERSELRYDKRHHLPPTH